MCSPNWCGPFKFENYVWNRGTSKNQHNAPKRPESVMTMSKIQKVKKISGNCLIYIVKINQIIANCGIQFRNISHIFKMFFHVIFNVNFHFVIIIWATYTHANVIYMRLTSKRYLETKSKSQFCWTMTTYGMLWSGPRLHDRSVTGSHADVRKMHSHFYISSQTTHTEYFTPRLGIEKWRSCPIFKILCSLPIHQFSIPLKKFLFTKKGNSTPTG